MEPKAYIHRRFDDFFMLKRWKNDDALSHMVPMQSYNICSPPHVWVWLSLWFLFYEKKTSHVMDCGEIIWKIISINVYESHIERIKFIFIFRIIYRNLFVKPCRSQTKQKTSSRNNTFFIHDIISSIHFEKKQNIRSIGKSNHIPDRMETIWKWYDWIQRSIGKRQRYT